MRIVIVRHIPINYWLIGVLKLNILQVMWLWQFQNFTNRKPCLQHGFAAFRLDGIRSGSVPTGGKWMA